MKNPNPNNGVDRELGCLVTVLFVSFIILGLALAARGAFVS